MAAHHHHSAVEDGAFHAQDPVGHPAAEHGGQIDETAVGAHDPGRGGLGHAQPAVGQRVVQVVAQDGEHPVKREPLPQLDAEQVDQTDRMAESRAWGSLSHANHPRLRDVKVASIHLAPGSHLPMRSIDTVEAEAGKGLVGDRYHGSRYRRVTIQSREALDRTADQLGYEFWTPVRPAETSPWTPATSPPSPDRGCASARWSSRWSSAAAPCRLMEDAVGPGATAAPGGRAGSACRVLSSGTIRVGDPVELLDD